MSYQRQWIVIDGSSDCAANGLKSDAEKKGYRVVKWSYPPVVRQLSNGEIEWLCDVEKLNKLDD